MKIMAIDYGDARTGFAISDRSEFLASPIGTVSERNAERLADKAAQTAAEYGAGEIIVGLPINMNCIFSTGRCLVSASACRRRCRS